MCVPGRAGHLHHLAYLYAVLLGGKYLRVAHGTDWPSSNPLNETLGVEKVATAGFLRVLPRHGLVADGAVIRVSFQLRFCGCWDLRHGH